MHSNLLNEKFLLKLQTSTQILRSLDHRLRQRMIDLIDLHYLINAEGLANELGLEPSIINHHLDILRRTEMVKTKREGKQFFFYVNYERLDKVNQFVIKLNQLLPSRSI